MCKFVGLHMHWGTCLLFVFSICPDRCRIGNLLPHRWDPWLFGLQGRRYEMHAAMCFFIIAPLGPHSAKWGALIVCARQSPQTNPRRCLDGVSPFGTQKIDIGTGGPFCILLDKTGLWWDRFYEWPPKIEIQRQSSVNARLTIKSENSFLFFDKQSTNLKTNA